MTTTEKMVVQMTDNRWQISEVPVWRWDFSVFGLDIWFEIDCDSRIGRWIERRELRSE